MAFDPNIDSFDRGCREWYRPINPNEHVYIAGYGFSPKPPFIIEQRLVAYYSTAVSLCLIGFWFLSSFLIQFFNRLLDGLVPVSFYSAQPIGQISTLLGSLFALVVPFLIYALHIHIPAKVALPLRRVPASTAVLAVMMALSMSVLGIYCSQSIYYVFSVFNVYFYEPVLVLPEGLASTVVYVLNLTVVPAVFEEIAFRGVLMQSLRRFGDSFALLVSSILFALVHGSPLSMANAFLMSLVIGYFVLFTGSLYTGMIIHLVHNLFSLLISQLGSIGHSTAYVVFLSVQLFYILLGIVAAVLLARRYGDIFALRRSDSINRFPKKLVCFFCTLPFSVFLILVYMSAGAYRI